MLSFLTSTNFHWKAIFHSDFFERVHPHSSNFGVSLNWLTFHLLTTSTSTAVLVWRPCLLLTFAIFCIFPTVSHLIISKTKKDLFQYLKARIFDFGWVSDKELLCSYRLALWDGMTKILTIRIISWLHKNVFLISLHIPQDDKGKSTFPKKNNYSCWQI